MKITVHIPDILEKKIKKASKNEGVSVSSLVAKATEFYLTAKKKKKAGEKVLELAGKARVAPDTLKELQLERRNDRA